MAWKIDRDYISYPNASNNTGIKQGELEGEVFTFRLRDDDDEVYYHGVADSAAATNDMEYGGLYQAYEWAMNDSGCTDLQVRASNALEHGLTSQSYLDNHNLSTEDWVSIYG